jgi:hypothetical protein
LSSSCRPAYQLLSRLLGTTYIASAADFADYVRPKTTKELQADPSTTWSQQYGRQICTLVGSRLTLLCETESLLA